MNSDKHRARSIRGNAMIYILLALALLGGLTMVLAQQNDDAGSQSLSAEKAELETTKIIAHAATVKGAVDNMLMSGTNINNLNLSSPFRPEFLVGKDIDKLYHPSGGGLSYQAMDMNYTDPALIIWPGWYIGRFSNVEWTPTTANDIILADYGINKSVCENINKKITGSTTIPVITRDLRTLFMPYELTAQTTVNFMKADCPTCDGYSSLCVSDSGGTAFLYYNIIVGK